MSLSRGGRISREPCSGWTTVYSRTQAIHKYFIHNTQIFLCISSDLTLDDVLLRVEGHDGEGVVVEAGEAVDEVGTGERVDVRHGEVEGGGAVD